MNTFLPTKFGVPKEDLMSSSVVRFLASPNSTNLMSLESILTHKMFSGWQRNKTVNSIFHLYDKIIMALNRCRVGGMGWFLFMQKQRCVFNLAFFSSGLTLVLISSLRWETLEVSFWCYPTRVMVSTCIQILFKKRRILQSVFKQMCPHVAYLVFEPFSPVHMKTLDDSIPYSV